MEKNLMINPMTTNLKVRTGWLRAMYLYTVLGAGGVGVASLLNAGPFASSDTFLAATIGSVQLGFAAVALLGLRAPLKFVPVLALQLVYKVIWFALAFLPSMLQGNAPATAPMLAIVFATFIIGDLIAIPFIWLFHESAQ